MSASPAAEQASMPMISIIIPAYNAEKFIDKTIESVQHQTCTDWEIIVVNDGSTDGTGEKVKAYGSEKIKLVSQSNQGVSASRNNGIAVARGRYIALLDADDYWLPHNLQSKLDVLEKNPDVDFVFSDFYFADENLVIKENAPKGTDVNMLENYLFWRRTVVAGPCSNLFLRKRCFESGLKFDPEFSTLADRDFCFYLVKNFKGRHLDDITCMYRMYSTSMSRNIAVFTKDNIGMYKKAARKKLFKNAIEKHRCFSIMYLMIAGAWWVEGHDKLKSIKFMMLALLHNPASILSLVQRVKIAR